MQDSRSQPQVCSGEANPLIANFVQNREWAYEVLRARLSEKRYNEEVEARRANRLTQIKGSTRSDKVRTYNFSQVSQTNVVNFDQADRSGDRIG